jgi:PKD repeat protein
MSMGKFQKGTRVFLFLLLFSCLVNFLHAYVTYADEIVLQNVTLSDLDSGSTSHTNSPIVHVAFDCIGSPSEMLLSERSDFSGVAWKPYENPTTFEFTAYYCYSSKTLYCKLRNASLEESDVNSDGIYLDICRPYLMTIYSGSLNITTIEVAFNEFLANGTDPLNYTITDGITVLMCAYIGSSYGGYRYRLATTPHIPGSEYTVTASEDLHDSAGNYIKLDERTYTYIASEAIDIIPPQVDSFAINEGASYTNSRIVNISMTESDQDSVVVKWLITEDTLLPTPPLAEDFILTERPVTYTLSEGDGGKLLFAWVMDGSDNISSFSFGGTYDSIILDQTSPSANAGENQTVTPDTEVALDGSLSTDNYKISRYIWDFGDGSSTEEGETITHTYTSRGDYIAILSVYDEAGNGPSTDDVVITVEGPLVVGGPDADYNTISEAMAAAKEGTVINVNPGIYYEDVHMEEGVILNGFRNNTTIINGNVFFEEVDATINNFTILFCEGSTLAFTNVYYTDWNLLANAGITAINSSPVIQNCVIKPDLEAINAAHLYEPPLEHYGKAIQIWNMYDPDVEPHNVEPHIEGNLIQNTDCGIYYFSQAYGGAINGEIKNNTFYHNKYGVVLRMHKEIPLIKNNIFDGCSDAAICFIYEDNVLFNERKANIHHNLFNANSNNLFVDSSQASLNLIDFQNNINLGALELLYIPGTENMYLHPHSPAGTASDTGFYVGAYPTDAEPPTIAIDFPEIENKKFIEELTVTGTASDANGIIYVNVNTETASINGTDFSVTLSVSEDELSYGVNPLVATACDLAGRTAITGSREIYIFRTPIAPPQ